jgi:hypothetical protein
MIDFFRRRLRIEMPNLRGGNIAVVISRLNPILPGLGSLLLDGGLQAFTTIDSYPWWLTFKWAVQPSEQVEEVGDHPLLRPVQQGQARSVGVRPP